MKIMNTVRKYLPAIVGNAITLGRESNLFYLYVFFQLVSMVLSLYKTNMMIYVTNGDFSYVSRIIFLTMIMTVLNSGVISYTKTLLGNFIQNRFMEDAFNQYDRISFDDKRKYPWSTFYGKVKPARDSIMMMIFWGSSQIIYLVVAFLGAILTFYQKGVLNILIFFLGLYCGFQYLIVGPYQDRFKKENEKLRNSKDKKDELISLQGIPFQYKEIQAYIMTSLFKERSLDNLKIEIFWMKIMGTTNIVSNLMNCLILYLISTDSMTFVLFFYTMGQLTSAVDNLTTFITAFKQEKEKFDDYTTIWKDTTQQNEPERAHLTSYPAGITVENAVITIGNDKNVVLESPFTIEYGTKMLIEGPSGHGKTSFIRGLFGLLERATVKFSEKEGKNFYHLVADYFQEIKERMPTSKVSLRDHFKCEISNETIYRYLKLAWGTETERILDNIRESFTKKSSYDVENSLDVFDMPIDEKLSGGEKSRLLLWTRGYVADHMNKEIIILDEPCPDVDFNSYIEQMRAFFGCYDNRTIIMIAHLCHCKRKALDADTLFNLEFWVEDGVIQQKQK
jgi:ABC-type multidrug transport system fused ATPase/permease subunit